MDGQISDAEIIQIFWIIKWSNIQISRSSNLSQLMLKIQKNISDNQTSLNAMDDADKAHYRSLAR